MGHKHFIESGAHLMLMPKNPSSLDGQSLIIQMVVHM